MTEPRLSRDGDEASLRRLWETVFGPEKDFIDLFFRKLYSPGSAAVAEIGGEIVSAAYVVSFGKARYIYAVATLPEYRGRGLGKAVTMLSAGREPAYLYPADRDLREWYMRRMGARPVNFRPIFDTPTDLRPIPPAEYTVRREALLKGVPHAEYPPAVTELFALTGSFYADGKGGIWAMEDGEIREALPCRFSDEPYLLGLNGAEPLYWGLTLS